MKITFLGTGTSHGVPMIGCKCSTCCSKNPKNRRYRTSIYIKVDDQAILVDTPPEMRLQLLENNITKVDTILFTHPHADHIMGFDDIRSLNRIQKSAIPCFGNEYTINEIKKIFDYIFNAVQIGGGIPQVQLQTIDSSFIINKIKITPLPVKHGKLDVFGYKIRNVAYITDCSFIPKTTMDLISDVDILIIDALRYRPHSTHMNIEQALVVASKLNVKQTYFTHITHDIEHEKVNNELPDNVNLAYDRLEICL